ncbi:hypothetical protein ADEAN_000976100 [Angomonas deanei]|uniref:Uncharacterized protein n=1 Tax=Angomonas deanei TaxID=59799 RepID=A0A7G2CT45_9TRYP|nr:hypothetical protein ADEAN_000976100 [Angomonas deanei]
MSFVTLRKSTRVPDIAKELNLKSQDIWLPLDVCQAKRATKPFVIKDNCALVLVNRETKECCFNRREILETIGKAGESPRSLSLTPGDIPEQYALFVQWRYAGGRNVDEGVTIFHKVMNAAEAFQKGSAFPFADTSSEDPQSWANQGKQIQSDLAKEREKRRRCEEDFQERASQYPSLQTDSFLHTMLGQTKEHITQRRRCPPLVYLSTKGASSVEVVGGGVRWGRPNPSLIYRVFRAEESHNKAYTTDFKDASQQVVFLFVNSICDFRRTDAPLDEMVCETLSNKVLDYTKRGFRVVLLDHLPTLHYSSPDGIHQTLSPIVEFCREYCSKKGFPITVLLSVVSNTIALQSRSASSLALPQSGILNYFISQLNASLAPDPALSFAVVNEEGNQSPFTVELYNSFLRRCSIRKVARSEFVK